MKNTVKITIVMLASIIDMAIVTMTPLNTVLAIALLLVVSTCVLVMSDMLNVIME